MTFNLRLFAFLSLGFMLFTVIGTLSHEFGHYAIARLLGFEARINYGSTSTSQKETTDFLKSTYLKHGNEIAKDLDFPGKQKYITKGKKYRKDRFLITLGGPLQTMLTGTLGLLLILAFYKNFRQKDRLTVVNWLLVFVALFWLRQPANLFTGFMGYIRRGRLSGRGDETIIATYLNLPSFTILISSGIIGLLVLAFITFKVIPVKQRLTFLTAGLFGGISGFVLWLMILGPRVMP